MSEDVPRAEEYRFLSDERGQAYGAGYDAGVDVTNARWREVVREARQGYQTMYDTARFGSTEVLAEYVIGALDQLLRALGEEA